MQEQVFLDDIAANPVDDMAKLVYADWLEEQGDPFGDFIRFVMGVGKTRINALPPRLDRRVRQAFPEVSLVVEPHQFGWWVVLEFPRAQTAARFPIKRGRIFPRWYRAFQCAQAFSAHNRRVPLSGQVEAPLTPLARTSAPHLYVRSDAAD